MPPRCLPPLRPLHDPARDRADGRRLAAAFGLSGVLHVAGALVWLAAGPPEIGEMPVLELLPPPVVLTDVTPVPDPPGAGGGGGGPETEPPAGDGAEAPSVRAPASTAPPPRARPVVPGASAPELDDRPLLPGVGGTSGTPGAGGTGGAPGGPPGGGGSGPPGVGPPGAPPPPPPPRTPRVVERPQRSPRDPRLSVPPYPEAARREGLRARVRVRVLVSETGAVLTAEIAERFTLDRRDTATPVASLPYGMDDAALVTARNARFTPAQDGGEAVRTHTFVTVTFDPPRGG